MQLGAEPVPTNTTTAGEFDGDHGLEAGDGTILEKNSIFIPKLLGSDVARAARRSLEG